MHQKKRKQEKNNAPGLLFIVLSLQRSERAEQRRALEEECDITAIAGMVPHGKESEAATLRGPGCSVCGLRSKAAAQLGRFFSGVPQNTTYLH